MLVGTCTVLTVVGIMLAGLISFGIAHIKGGNGPWRVRQSRS